jgi:hypothetical protein
MPGVTPPPLPAASAARLAGKLAALEAVADGLRELELEAQSQSNRSLGCGLRAAQQLVAAMLAPNATGTTAVQAVKTESGAFLGGLAGDDRGDGASAPAPRTTASPPRSGGAPQQRADRALQLVGQLRDALDAAVPSPLPPYPPPRSASAPSPSHAPLGKV